MCFKTRWGSILKNRVHVSYHVTILIKVTFNINATLLFSHFVESDPTFFPFLENLNFSCYFFLHLCRYVLKCVSYNCHFGCDLKSVAYIQDRLLIRNLSFLVCL